MRQYLAVAFAAVVGALAGIQFARLLHVFDTSSMSVLEVRELVLVNEKRLPTARLSSVNGMTSLRFYGREGSPELEIGVDTTHSERHIRFFGKDSKLVAALTSVGQNGETSLYMGDERWQTRVILGALSSDIGVGTQPINEWGLVFRKPGSTQPLFNVLLKSEGDSQETTAAIRLIRSNGASWTK